MKKNLIFITAVVLMMLIAIGVNTVLADGLTPVGVPVGKAASGQIAPAIVLGTPVGIPALLSGDEFAKASHLSKPQSQPAEELALPTNP